MEDRENQLDMAKMAVAFLKALHTCLAPIILVGHSHSLVKRSMGVDRSIPLKVEQSSIRDLNERLMDDISIRSVRRLVSGIEFVKGISQDTKLQFLNHLGHSVNHLHLSPTQQKRFWSLHLHARVVTASVCEERRDIERTGSSSVEY